MNNEKIQRGFILGSEWLYFNIYTGINVSDTILTEVIKPVTNKLLQENIIDSWFFIRYRDPEYHLRIRFHLTDKKLLMNILDVLNPYFKNFLNEGLIWKIQTDTYSREIERYGADSMLLSEELFYCESKMVVNFLDLIEGNDGEESRWLFALACTDSLLEIFQFSLTDKINLLEYLNTNMGDKFGLNTNKNFKIQLGNKYRQESEKIKMILDRNGVENRDIFSLIRLRKNEIEQSVHEILTLDRAHKLNITLRSLVTSFSHMQLNRIFKSKSNQHEMICYNFLFRYYKSLYAQRGKVL